MIKEYLGNDIYQIQFSSGEEITLSLENIKELHTNSNAFLPEDEALLFDDKKHIEIDYLTDYIAENTDLQILTLETKNDIEDYLEDIKTLTKSDKIVTLVNKILYELD